MVWDHPSEKIGISADPLTNPFGRAPDLRWLEWRRSMPDATVERRSAPRYPLVLAAEVVELPRGARLKARTSDISSKGCYVDTLNPIPQGTQIRLRLTHNDEIFEAMGRVVYVSPGLGMGIIFETVTPDQQSRLDRWLTDPNREF
jgi:Ribonuclease G/E